MAPSLETCSIGKPKRQCTSTEPTFTSVMREFAEAIGRAKRIASRPVWAGYFSSIPLTSGPEIANSDQLQQSLECGQRRVMWHDGKPFTAKDVRCTWDLLTGTAREKFRVNPRKSWYRDLDPDQPPTALRLRRRVELQWILQPRGGQADRSAIDRGRSGKAQAAGVGDRAETGGGRRPADHLLRPPRHLLASSMAGASKTSGWTSNDCGMVIQPRRGATPILRLCRSSDT
jgi:hypothetical protein